MQKIKQFIKSEEGKDFLIFIIIILTAFCSFYLGRLSKNSQNEGLKIQYAPMEANALKTLENDQFGLNKGVKTPQNEPKASNLSQFAQENPNLDKSKIEVEKKFFASSRGKKYYSYNCQAGKSIKVENRIYFKTENEAKKAGYEPSSSCDYD